MDNRKLGQLEVSPIGMGCMGFSHGYGQVPPEAYAIEAIRKAYDYGCTHFDTAEAYGKEQFYAGHNEELVGKAIEPFRKEVVLATKFHIGELPQPDETSLYREMRRHLEDSMSRLRTDYIDLYYLHRINETVRLEDVATVMGRLVKEGLIDPQTLIIDAKSGTSGAGRGAKVNNLYCEVNENIKAYGVATHRHTPEIEEQLGYAAGKEILVNFTPHLVPMNRGILVTEYATLTKKADGSLPTYEEIRAVYDKYYADEYFVRVLEKNVCPETKWVEGSNFVDVNFKIDERTGRIIMMGALDNIVKGAAGQAVQNMNLMFGLDEKEGLELVPMFP